MKRTCLTLAVAGAALIGCADTQPSPMAVAAPTTPASIVSGCSVFSDTGCPIDAATIDVASVDLGSGSLLSTSGTRYYATIATTFHPVQLPPNPVLPSDPYFARVGAWNALVGTSAGFRAYLALINTLPPNPVIPNDPVRYDVVARIVGTSYYLTDVTPVIAP